MDTANALFEHELRDIYDAENKLVKALERMAKVCNDKQLVEGFREHLQVTKGQVTRLEQVFELIGRKPRREACAGINGLIEEFSKFVEEHPEPTVLDAFANGAAQKVEKYEICSYESLIELGQLLGLTEAVQLFEQSKTEEEQTAEKLHTLSDRLNQKLSVDKTITLPVEERR